MLFRSREFCANASDDKAGRDTPALESGSNARLILSSIVSLAFESGISNLIHLTIRECLEHAKYHPREWVNRCDAAYKESKANDVSLFSSRLRGKRKHDVALLGGRTIAIHPLTRLCETSKYHPCEWVVFGLFTHSSRYR